MTCGIYMIKNKNTGQIYIGQSNNIERRWRDHYSHPVKKTQYFSNAIHKYGPDAFEYYILYSCSQYDIDLLNELEKYYIWKYDTYTNKKHYNMTPGGDFNPMSLKENALKVTGKNNPMYGCYGNKNPWYGHHHTDDAKKIMSKKKKGLYKGQKHPLSKYTLWDSSFIRFLKRKGKYPRKCFTIKYNNYIIPSFSFIEFVSCIIIFNIIKNEGDTNEII